jgi:hypothetical protein
MAEELSDAELDQIEQRAARAFAVAPQPWVSFLETRHGIGGGSFVRFGGGPNDDNEMYLEVHLGAHQLTSPDPSLDAILDFVGQAAQDVPRLVGEVRRLRGRVG